MIILDYVLLSSTEGVIGNGGGGSNCTCSGELVGVVFVVVGGLACLVVVDGFGSVVVVDGFGSVVVLVGEVDVLCTFS